MTMSEADTAQYLGTFNEEWMELLRQAGEPELVARKREEAFACYRATPNPTPFDEEWRRTDPSRIRFEGMNPLPVLPERPAGEPGPHDAEFDVVVSVNDQGYSIVDVTGAMKAETVHVTPLAAAVEACPEGVGRHVNGRILPPEFDKFVAFNQAFWNVGLIVYIPEGKVLEKGVLIRYEITTDHAVLIPQLLVVAGKESQATVVETTVSPDRTRMLSVSTKALYVADAARLKMVTLQEWGKESLQVGNDMAAVGRDAQVDMITLNFGTQLSKLKLGSDVEGENSSAELDGLFFCDRDQHIDQKTLQVHSAPHTYSRLLYKGAVRDQGHSVYQGVIQARKGAVKVDAYQTNNNLILTDGAKADTIPGLLIDADDLKCSHGATIGNLDPDQLFYLRARGLPEAEARRILIRGFYDEVADRLPFAFLRDRVHATIDDKLGVGDTGAVHEDVG